MQVYNDVRIPGQVTFQNLQHNAALNAAAIEAAGGSVQVLDLDWTEASLSFRFPEDHFAGEGEVGTCVDLLRKIQGRKDPPLLFV